MEKYDIAIIGSGLGGLCCARILGMEGYKVCVIEKNKQFGGSLQTFVREKVIFDTGVHYVGGLAPGQNLNKFFTYMGVMDGLKLKRMDMDGFDLISFNGDENNYPLSQGHDRFVKNLLRYFPEEEKALISYSQTLKKVCDEFPLYNVEAGGTANVNPEYFTTGAKAFIESLTGNKKLQHILAGNNLLYAGVADKTPLFIHALITNSYILSSWKFVDGGSQLPKLLVRGIRENGGNVIRNQEVKQLEFSGDKIKFAVLENGDKIEADNFISNIHPLKTLDLIEQGRIRKAFRTRLGNLENSISGFSLHLVLKKDSFEYLNHNHYHFSENNAWGMADYSESSWPKGYMMCTPASSKSEKFAESITLLCYMKYNEVKKWEHTFNTVSKESKRAEDYRDFSNKKAEKIIQVLEKKFPGLREKVKSFYTSSPLSYRDYLGNYDGSMYGILKDYNHPEKTTISPRTKIPNLLLTGQNIHIHGVLGVTVGTILTCAELVGQDYLVRKINEAYQQKNAATT